MTKHKIINYCDNLINWLFVTMVFLTPLWFAYFEENYSVFELNKQVVVRAGVSVILSLFLLKTVLGAKIIYYKKIIWPALILPILYIVVGVIFSINPSVSWWGNYERQQGVLSLLYYWLFLMLLLANLQSIKQIKNIFSAVFISAATVSIYGVTQHFNWDFKRWAESPGRAFSSLGQPNFLGHYLVMTIALTFGGWSLFVNKNKYWWWPSLLILELTCLLYTASRSAWLALTLGCLLPILFLFLQASFKKKKLAFLLSMILIGFLLFISLSNKKKCDNLWCGINQRFASSFNWQSDTAKIRQQYWLAAPQALTDAPWWRSIIGFGKDSQANIFVKLYHSDWSLYEKINSFPDRAHNLLIDDWLEFGFLGLVIIIGFNLFIFGRAVRYLFIRRQIADAEYYLTAGLVMAGLSYFIAAFFGFPLTTQYLYYNLILGCLIFIVFKSEQSELSLAKFSRLFKISIALMLIGFIFFCFYLFTIKAYLGDMAYMQAKRAAAQADCVNTLDYANKMLDYWPVSVKFQEQYAAFNTNCVPFLTNQKDLHMVADNVLGVFDVYPVNGRSYGILNEQAHAYSVFGRFLDQKFYSQAQTYYLALIKLNPEISVTYQDYARMKFWVGDYEAAEKIIWQGLAVLPTEPSLSHQSELDNQKYAFYDLLSRLKAQTGEVDQAIDYLLTAHHLKPKDSLDCQKISDLYWRQHKLKESIAWLEQGKLLDPADSAWDYNKALHYLAVGSRSQALTAAKTALKLNPNDPQIRRLIVDIEADSTSQSQP